MTQNQHEASPSAVKGRQRPGVTASANPGVTASLSIWDLCEQVTVTVSWGTQSIALCGSERD